MAEDLIFLQVNDVYEMMGVMNTCQWTGNWHNRYHIYELASDVSLQLIIWSWQRHFHYNWMTLQMCQRMFNFWYLWRRNFRLLWKHNIASGYLRRFFFFKKNQTYFLYSWYSSTHNTLSSLICLSFDKGGIGLKKDEDSYSRGTRSFSLKIYVVVVTYDSGNVIPIKHTGLYQWVGSRHLMKHLVYILLWGWEGLLPPER